MSHGVIKAVIFDLGNVLVDFDHRIASQKITRHCPKEASQIYNLFFDSGITRLFEEGRIPKEEFFNRVKAMLELDLDFSSFLPIWNDIFFLSDKNRAVHALAQNLKKRYLTVLLSNINILHYEYLKENFPVFEAFHKVFASCDIGYVKPDHQIYIRVLSALGVAADEVFYTDDRPELIESAAGLGIRGAVFCGIEQLKIDLVSAGVNIE